MGLLKDNKPIVDIYQDGKEIDSIYKGTKEIYSAGVKVADDSIAHIKSIPSGSKFARVDSIGGKSYVENQIAPSVLVMNGNNMYPLTKGASVVAGHKYYMSYNAENHSDKLTLSIYTLYNGTNTIVMKLDCLATQNKVSGIVVANYSGVSLGTTTREAGNIWLYQWVTNDNDYFSSNLKIVDLTVKYGAGNEPTDIAQVEAELTENERNGVYTEPTIQHTTTESVVVRGKNLWNYQGAEFVKRAGGNEDTLTINEDGTIVVNKVSALTFNYRATTNFENGIYSFSGMGNVADKAYCEINSTDGSVYGNMVNKKLGGEGYYTIYVDASLKGTFTFKPQMEKGAVATSYSVPMKQSYPIPQEIQALEGYGWSAGSVCNEVAFARGKYVQREDRVDLGSLTWVKNAFFANIFNCTELKNIIKPAKNSGVRAKVMCANYDIQTSSNIGSYDKGVAVGDSGIVYVKDVNYTEPSDFKSAMQGVYLYYELAEPIETDISDSIGWFEAEAGGSITFENTENSAIPIPNSITYKVKRSAAIASLSEGYYEDTENTVEGDNEPSVQR